MNRLSIKRRHRAPSADPLRPAGGLRRAVARGAAATFALRLGGMALGLTAGIVLARTLGAAGYGTYSWAFSLASAIGVLVTLGADQLLTRESGRTLETTEWDGLRALLRAALVRVTLLSVVVAAVVAVGVLVAGGGLGARRTALLVALPIVPFSALGAIGQGSLLGLGRTVSALAPGTFARQGLFCVLVGLAALLGGLASAGAVAFQLTATAATSTLVLVLLLRALRRAPRTPGVPLPVARPWMRSSVAMGAASMFLVFDAQIGLLVLGGAGRTKDAGVYAAALQCNAPFSLVLLAGRLPLSGVVARLAASGDRVRLQRGLRTATRGAAAVSAVIALVLLLVPDLVLSVFGGDFAAGAPVVRIVAVSALVNAVTAFNGMVLLMGGEERIVMLAALGCLVFDAALCLALVPAFGAKGAALAGLVSLTVRNIFNCTMTRRRLGVDTSVLGRL